jgi:hypothetical protein
MSAAADARPPAAPAAPVSAPWLPLVLAAVVTGGEALARTDAPAAPAVPAAAEAVALPLAGARLAGQGTLRFLGLDIYRARLWVTPGFRAETFGESPLALELEYLRDFRAEAIARRSLSEMRRVGNFDEARARRWQQALQAALPDVRAGDRLMGVHRPDRGVVFQQGGRTVGEVADPEFARLFFGIWLSPATSEPALREALLVRAGAS